MKNLALLMSFMSFCFVAIGQKTILLDNYYNNEIKEKTSKPYHYLWIDEETSGFSEFGKLFENQGCRLSVLQSKPDQYNLKNAHVYIIVDPDTRQESVNPQFMDHAAVMAIVDWVKQGGVLLVLANDSKNCELDSLNLLMSMFGMKFNDEILHAELSASGKSRNFNSCASINLSDHPLFQNVKKIFIKGISSISCTTIATPILQEDDKTFMAEAVLGKGKVIAIGDPWLYNEYIDHLFLPEEFQNYEAAKNLVEYLLK
jgi:unsaturated rhamnogalacturonyl hydrolase